MLIRIREYDSSPSFAGSCDIQIPIHMRPTSYELKDALFELGKYAQVTNDIDVQRDTQTILKQFKGMVQSHSLALKIPELAAEWDYEMNAGLTPAMFSYGSSYPARWICSKCGQRWEAKIYSRANGNGCPYCSGLLAIPGQTDLETNYPDYAKFWDYQSNAETPMNVTPGSKTEYYWICSICGNSYLSSPHNRIGNKSTVCKDCSNKLRSEKIWKARRTNGTIHPNNAKKIYQYSLDNEYIACYDSVYQASEKTGFNRKSISDAANGRQKTCGGYIWTFDKLLF